MFGNKYAVLHPGRSVCFLSVSRWDFDIQISAAGPVINAADGQSEDEDDANNHDSGVDASDDKGSQQTATQCLRVE